MGHCGNDALRLRFSFDKTNIKENSKFVFFFFQFQKKKIKLDFINFFFVFFYFYSILFLAFAPLFTTFPPWFLAFPLRLPQSPHSQHSHPHFPHSHSDSPHHHHDSPHYHPDSQLSHPDSPLSHHSVPRFPIPAFTDSQHSPVIYRTFHSFRTFCLNVIPIKKLSHNFYLNENKCYMKTSSDASNNVLLFIILINHVTNLSWQVYACKYNYCYSFSMIFSMCCLVKIMFIVL